VLEQLEGSQAIAKTVARCRPEVISAYPISPQTHIVEGLSDLVRTGELAPCEYMMVESEFAAMSACIGASAVGARTYTATASQGLLYMVEALYNASGLGLPIVMTVANRAIGAPINIWNDHSDSMSQRDSGWIQLYAETNQEAADLHVQPVAHRVGPDLVVLDLLLGHRSQCEPAATVPRSRMMFSACGAVADRRSCARARARRRRASGRGSEACPARVGRRARPQTARAASAW
jgi:Pyruvate flavodoxin/ferredoxin oxidoreductase, thiamine diP-bdg